MKKRRLIIRGCNETVFSLKNGYKAKHGFISDSVKKNSVSGKLKTGKLPLVQLRSSFALETNLKTQREAEVS